MDLTGKIALVAGGTRGASRAIAVELGRAGAFVYVTGRSTAAGRSEVDRPETIEETVALVEAAGGTGTAVRVDHLVPDEVRTLAATIGAGHGRLDILVDGVWGGDHHLQWGKPVWEHDLDASLRMLHLGIDAHVITAHALFPLVVAAGDGLVVELTDGIPEYDAVFRQGTSTAFYVAKTAAHQLVKAEAFELAPSGGTAVAFSPGWLRSEAMLEIFGVREDNWRDAIAETPHFAISETPTFVGRTVAALAADPGRHELTGQSLDSGLLAKRYGVDDVDGSRPDGWRYMIEVERAGLPADPETVAKYR
ncbi:SDR family oxidoreductase [Cryptosporangium japonicum]